MIEIQCQAIGTGDGAIPNEIQYLPPGQHTIVARTKGGGPKELKLHITAETARRLQSSVAEIRARGQEPFIDFNHAEGKAAGWVEALRWAGDNPLTGGVRALIRWTAAGLAALRGRDFRKFSPSFTVNDKGEIDGTSVTAGGLVNNPAFTGLVITASSGVVSEFKQLSADQIGDNLFPAANGFPALDEALRAFKNEVERIRDIPLSGGGKMPFQGAWMMAKRTKPELWRVLADYKQTGEVEEPRASNFDADTQVKGVQAVRGFQHQAESLVANAAFKHEVELWLAGQRAKGKTVTFVDAWSATKNLRPDLWSVLAKGR